MTPPGNQPRRTRLAPSPTGALHLGNAQTFLANWALARQQGWRILLRIEDLDGPRIKQEAATQAIDVLQWLGMDWDEGPAYQAYDLSPYEAALDALADAGLSYACTCSRKEIEQAQSAPHGDEHELRYPGTCRVSGIGVRDSASIPESSDARHPTPDTRSTRLIVPDEPISFTDTFRCLQSFNVQQQVGDFVISTKSGLPAYQLAVVVDDARQGITDVVRGDDLLGSTARQILLYRLMNLGEPPHYTHLPLVVGADGRRLAKRHGDTRLVHYRDAGVMPERIIGLIAHWCGVIDERKPMDAQTFLRQFQLDRMPRKTITFTESDEAWLRS